MINVKKISTQMYIYQESDVEIHIPTQSMKPLFDSHHWLYCKLIILAETL